MDVDRPRVDTVPRVVFDFETNGCKGANLYGGNQRVVQLAVRLENGDAAQWVVNPGLHIPHASARIHRVTNERARREGQPFGAVMTALWAWLAARGIDAEGQVVDWVAHNAFGFDRLLWCLEMERLGRTLPAQWRFFDTLPLCRRLKAHPEERCDLSSLHLKYLGRPLVGAHDAGADVEGLAALLPLLDPHATPADRRGAYEPPPPLDDDAPLLSVRGLGPARRDALVAKFDLPTPAVVGALRRALDGWSPARIEHLLRHGLGLGPNVRDDATIVELLAQLYDQNVLVLRGLVPFVEDAFELLEPFVFAPTVRKRLRLAGCRTVDALWQRFLYDCAEDKHAFQAFLLGDMGLSPSLWLPFCWRFRVLFRAFPR